MPPPYQVYLLLGSNIGDREAHFYFATVEIEKRIGVILQSSSFYETAPWGVTDQENYLNAALLIRTELPPESLFHLLKKIEEEAGRTDQRKYAPRTLDIDILFYDDLILHSKELTIPHPKLHLRKFVLVPLAEINRTLIHPVFKKSIGQLLEECPDDLEVKLLSVK